jgi:hypothetical protein
MKSQFATTMAKSGFRDIIMGKTQEDRSVYDVTMLMDTLTTVSDNMFSTPFVELAHTLAYFFCLSFKVSINICSKRH